MATKKTSYETPTPASDKKKALQTALAQIEKNFGKGTVMRLGDKPEMTVDAIPTGSHWSGKIASNYQQMPTWI